MGKKKIKKDKTSKLETEGNINLMDGEKSMDKLTELLYSLGQQDTVLKKVTNPNNRKYPPPVKESDHDFFLKHIEEVVIRAEQAGTLNLPTREDFIKSVFIDP